MSFLLRTPHRRTASNMAMRMKPTTFRPKFGRPLEQWPSSFPFIILRQLHLFLSFRLFRFTQPPPSFVILFSSVLSTPPAASFARRLVLNHSETLRNCEICMMFDLACFSSRFWGFSRYKYCNSEIGRDDGCHCAISLAWLVRLSCETRQCPRTPFSDVGSTRVLDVRSSNSALGRQGLHTGHRFWE